MSLMLSQPKIELGAPVVPKVSWDPPLIRPGDRAIYRLSLNALEDSTELPESLPFPAGLNARRGEQAQILVMSGTNMESRSSFIFHVRPNDAGTFTVPEYTIHVYGKPVTVPPATLRVAPNLPANLPQAQRLLIEVPNTNLYVGQAFRPKVMLPFIHGPIQTLSQARVSGQGLITDRSALRQRIEPVARAGTNLITFIYEPLVTPIMPGKTAVEAEGWSVVNRTTGPVYITNGVVMNLHVEHTLVDADPFELMVKPLPREGELAGFTGAVGRYTNDPPKLSTNRLRIGEPLKLRVTLRGDGNIARLVPPPAPKSAEWQVFEASGDPSPPQVLHAQGAVTFTYTMVPLLATVSKTPAIPFSYFDPELHRYVSSDIPETAVTVMKGGEDGDASVFAAAASATPTTPREPHLQPPANAPGVTTGSLIPLQQRSWFPLLQATPAFAFGLLWLWDRRRKYLASHPALALCGKARRALRRQRRLLSRALAERNASLFAEHAVAALQAITAPHYPAQPRALVGADVLAVLSTATGKAGGHAVRELFDHVDARSFSSESRDGNDILALEPALQSVLRDLEATVVAKCGRGRFLFLLTLVFMSQWSAAASPPLFEQGLRSYSTSEYDLAAEAFRKAADASPATGAFQNLGNAEWRRGRTGEAILAWERARWVDSYNRSARENLDYARKTAQLESPELAWYEVISTWLPVNAWAWITGAALWLAVAMMILPGILRRKKEAWHQAVAAFALMLFLLSVPAQAGVNTRTRLGFILKKNTPLRLTPTREAQALVHLPAGQPVRLLGERGRYLLVRSSRLKGWLEIGEAGFVCPR